MLAHENTQLIERDRELIGLWALLEPELLLESLRLQLPDHDLREPRTTYLRYKPRTGCIAAIELTLNGRRLEVYAKALSESKKLESLERKRRGSGTFGPSVIVLHDLQTAVYAFPKDRKLTALASLGDDGARPYLIEELLPNQPEFFGVMLEPLRYKPERRFVGKLKGSEDTAAIKVYLEHDFATAKHNAQCFQLCDAIRSPNVLGHSSNHATVIYEWLDGQVLHKPNAAQLEQVGAGLAELHAQQPTNLETRTFEQEAKAVLELAQWLTDLHPKLECSARSIAETLARAWQENTPDLRPTHGDFYQKQLLETGNGLGLIDFDEAAWNDPAIDLGNFIGHLERDFLLRDGLPMQAQPLLEGYRGNGGVASDGRILLASAIGLFKLAPSPFRYLQSGWLEQTELILERCEQMLNTTRAAHTSTRNSLRLEQVAP
jgi:Phosphotransferase enzyme family